jgi:hypothetical protein
MRTRIVVLLVMGLVLAPGLAAAQNATPAASPIAEGLELLHYEILPDPVGGHFHVLGEYRNVGAETIVAPVLALVLKDAAGAVVATANLVPANGHLTPGQTGGFVGDVVLKGGSWTTEELTVCNTSLLTPSDDEAVLELRDVAEVEKSSTQLVLTGTVFNTGATAVRDTIVTVIITRSRDQRFAGYGVTQLDTTVHAHAGVGFTVTVYADMMPGIMPGDAYTYTVAARFDRVRSVACG